MKKKTKQLLTARRSRRVTPPPPEFSSLPNPILLRIFQHLPPKQLLTCALVTRPWATLIASTESANLFQNFSDYLRKKYRLPADTTHVLLSRGWLIESRVLRDAIIQARKQELQLRRNQRQRKNLSSSGNQQNPLKNSAGSNKVKFNLFLLGHYDSGKSSLISRWKTGKFDPNLPPTNEKTKSVSVMQEIRGFQVTFEIWDSVGLGLYDAASPAQIRLSDAVLTVYDLANQRAWERVSEYLEMIAQCKQEYEQYREEFDENHSLKDSHNNPRSWEVLSVLVGNKNDFPKSDWIEPNRKEKTLIETFGENHGITRWWEVSAKSNENVNELLGWVGEYLLERDGYFIDEEKNTPQEASEAEMRAAAELENGKGKRRKGKKEKPKNCVVC